MAPASPSDPKTNCAFCGAGLDTRAAASALSPHLCADCGAPQPLRAGEDAFTLLSAPRAFAQDLAALEKRFYALSRALHPDRFAAQAGARAAEWRQASLERMSALNDAYQALRLPDDRRELILKLEGVPAPKAQAPADLANEWFDLQDVLMEDPAGAVARLRTFGEELSARERRAVEELEKHEQAYDQAGDSAEGRAALERLAQAIQGRSYLVSMKRDVERKLIQAGGAP